LTRILHDLDVSYVVVHPQLLSDGRRQAVASLMESVDELERVYDDREVLVFRRR
jgi:hypothetical protein